jgi:hypothetical protein
MARTFFLFPAVLIAGWPFFAGAALAGSAGHGHGGRGSGIAAHGPAGYGPNSPGIAAHGFNGRVGHYGGGWHGSHHRHRLSGLVSDGNATQTPFARPAIYKVEAVGRRGERQGAMPGQFRQLYGAQAFQPAGISLVSGSSFRAPPRVFVVKVPRG